jgi:hypothetical protein
MRLTELVHLDARFRQFEEDIDGAVNRLLDCLTVAQQIAQSQRFLFGLVALTVEERTLNLLPEVLREPAAARGAHAKARAFLAAYREQRFQIVNLMLGPRRDFEGQLEQLLEQLGQEVERMSKGARIGNEQVDPKLVDAFAARLRKQAEQVSTTHFELVTAALGCNDPTAWKAVDDHADGLRSALRGRASAALMPDIASAVLTGDGERMDVLAKIIASHLLLVSVPHFREAARMWYDSQKKLEAM